MTTDRPELDAWAAKVDSVLADGGMQTAGYYGSDDPAFAERVDTELDQAIDVDNPVVAPEVEQWETIALQSWRALTEDETADLPEWFDQFTTRTELARELGIGRDAVEDALDKAMFTRSIWGRSSCDCPLCEAGGIPGFLDEVLRHFAGVDEQNPDPRRDGSFRFYDDRADAFEYAFGQLLETANNATRDLGGLLEELVAFDVPDEEVERTMADQLRAEGWTVERADVPERIRRLSDQIRSSSDPAGLISNTVTREEAREQARRVVERFSAAADVPLGVLTIDPGSNGAFVSGRIENGHVFIDDFDDPNSDPPRGGNRAQRRGQNERPGHVSPNGPDIGRR